MAGLQLEGRNKARDIDSVCSVRPVICSVPCGCTASFRRRPFVLESGTLVEAQGAGSTSAPADRGAVRSKSAGWK